MAQIISSFYYYSVVVVFSCCFLLLLFCCCCLFVVVVVVVVVFFWGGALFKVNQHIYNSRRSLGLKMDDVKVCNKPGSQFVTVVLAELQCYFFSFSYPIVLIGSDPKLISRQDYLQKRSYIHNWLVSINMVPCSYIHNWLVSINMVPFLMTAYVSILQL